MRTNAATTKKLFALKLLECFVSWLIAWLRDLHISVRHFCMPFLGTGLPSLSISNSLARLPYCTTTGRQSQVLYPKLFVTKHPYSKVEVIIPDNKLQHCSLTKELEINEGRQPILQKYCDEVLFFFFVFVLQLLILVALIRAVVLFSPWEGHESKK